MDAINFRNVFQARYNRKPSTWSTIGIPYEKLENIDLELVNYHVFPLGTFHSKFAIIDRKIALVNSNNINIRSNVEMMCQFEGDIVNSLYETFLISWGTSLHPPLPCLNTPAEARRDFHFGNRDAYKVNRPNSEPGSDDTEDVHHSVSQHAHKATRALTHESKRYAKENQARTTIPINQRLNASKPAQQTKFDHETDFAPFYLHAAHDPVPMALVNRQPQPIPGHWDWLNPQNAAWLQGSALLTSL